MAFGGEPEFMYQYGIANAITRAAQRELSWEKNLELEKLGGKIITLSSQEFKSLDE